LSVYFEVPFLFPWWLGIYFISISILFYVIGTRCPQSAALRFRLCLHPADPLLRPQKVKHLVALMPKDYNKATAATKMYNIGVGKELLVGGRLKKRVTIIPLNKI
jgi:hypothetical protein